jgi:hypothetical protein
MVKMGAVQSRFPNFPRSPDKKTFYVMLVIIIVPTLLYLCVPYVCHHLIQCQVCVCVFVCVCCLCVHGCDKMSVVIMCC